MKNHIVANGSSNQVQLKELRLEIRERYRDQFAEANFLTRLWIYFKMNLEFKRKRRELEPSEQSLYSSKLTA